MFKTEFECISTIFDRVFSGQNAAYIARYVPQYSTNDSIPVMMEHNTIKFSELDRKKIENWLNNIDFRGDVRPVLSLQSEFGLNFLSTNIIFNETVNIGIFVFISTEILSTKKINDFVAQVSEIISLNKKSAALTYISDLSNQLPRRNSSEFFKFISDHFGGAMKCAEVLIVKPDGNNSDKYITAYSSTGRDVEISPGPSAVSYCVKKRKTLLDSDVFGSVPKPYSLQNHSLFTANNYHSFIAKALSIDDYDHAFIIICFFKRPYAISDVEMNLFETLSLSLEGLVAREKSVSVNDISEKEVKFDRLVKNCLLVADVMHDATEDLVVARNNLVVANPRSKLDKEKIEEIKTTLEEIIQVGRAFKDGMSAEKHVFTLKRRRNRKNNLREIVSEVMKKYTGSNEYNNIDFINSVPNNIEISCTRYSVKRAIDNAIKNSVFHLRGVSHRRRHVKVSIKRSADEITFVIYDNGSGMTEEVKDEALELMFTTTGGMGFGMSIIEAAALAHGGRIYVDSIPGLYCTLNFSLSLNN